MGVLLATLNLAMRRFKGFVNLLIKHEKVTIFTFVILSSNVCVYMAVLHRYVHESMQVPVESRRGLQIPGPVVYRWL